MFGHLAKVGGDTFNGAEMHRGHTCVRTRIYIHILYIHVRTNNQPMMWELYGRLQQHYFNGALL